MKGIIIFALFMFVAVATATKYGDACTHSGVQAEDDKACSGVNNNMLCSSASKCECVDKYGGATTDKYTPAADHQSCTKA